MLNFIQTDEKTIELYGGSSYSEGVAIETTARRRYDYTRTSRGYFFRRRLNAKTATITLDLSNVYFDNNETIVDYITSLEALVCQKIQVTINGVKRGDYIVTGIQTGIGPDAQNIISTASVTINLTQGRLKMPYVEQKVATGFEV